MEPIRNLRRIISLGEDILYLAGRSLQRRAWRNGILIALAYGSAMFKINLGSAGTPNEQQILGLMVAAFASYPLGTLLVRIADISTRGNIAAASSGHLHLTSHYKQSRAAEHLGRLWDEVFVYESRLHRTIDHVINEKALLATTRVHFEHIVDRLDELMPVARNDMEKRRADLIDDLMSSFPHSPELEAHRPVFVYTGLYGLRRPLPQRLQIRKTGFDLGPLEDWYEKGLFTYEDFPGKAFGRDLLVHHAFDLVRAPWLNRLYHWWYPEPLAPFWYALTARKVGIAVGRAITGLNRRNNHPHKPWYFNAQHLLWPDPDLESTIRADFGADAERLGNELRAARAGNLAVLFADSDALKRQQVLRMFMRDLRRIVRLRLAFDPEYAGGALGQDPVTDCERIARTYGLELLSASELDRRVRHGRATLARIADVEPAADPLIRRGLLIVLHTDRPGVSGSLAAACDPDDESLPRLNAMLTRIRFYHCLAMLQVELYCDVVDFVTDPGGS